MRALRTVAEQDIAADVRGAPRRRPLRRLGRHRPLPDRPAPVDRRRPVHRPRLLPVPAAARRARARAAWRTCSPPASASARRTSRTAPTGCTRSSGTPARRRGTSRRSAASAAPCRVRCARSRAARAAPGRARRRRDRARVAGGHRRNTRPGARVFPSMRVLITTTGSAGHLGPLIPFADAIRDAGGEVLVATRASTADAVRAAGLRRVAVRRRAARTSATRSSAACGGCRTTTRTSASCSEMFAQPRRARRAARRARRRAQRWRPRRRSCTRSCEFARRAGRRAPRHPGRDASGSGSRVDRAPAHGARRTRRCDALRDDSPSPARRRRLARTSR